MKPPVIIQKVDVSCAKAWGDPPKYPNPQWKECEEPCEAWLGLADADQLADYLEQVQSWVKEAEVTCKPKEGTEQ